MGHIIKNYLILIVIFVRCEHIALAHEQKNIVVTPVLCED